MGRSEGNQMFSDISDILSESERIIDPDDANIFSKMFGGFSTFGRKDSRPNSAKYQILKQHYLEDIDGESISLESFDMNHSGKNIFRRITNWLKVPVYLNIRYITFTGCHLPVLGIIICLTLAMMYDRDRPDSKFCGTRAVKNFWPWLSHAISSTPRAYTIWNILIWAHAPIRFLGSRLLYNSYKLLFNRMIDEAARSGRTADTSFGCCCCHNYQTMIKCAHYINNLEIICLLTLSVVTSHSIYDIHVWAVTLFTIFTLIFTIMASVIEARLNLKRMVTFMWFEFNFYSIRHALTTTYCVFFVLVSIFYNWYLYACMDYVYSWFGLCELVLVLSNIYSHGFAVIIVRDFLIPEELQEFNIFLK